MWIVAYVVIMDCCPEFVPHQLCSPLVNIPRTANYATKTEQNAAPPARGTRKSLGPWRENRRSSDLLREGTAATAPPIPAGEYKRGVASVRTELVAAFSSRPLEVPIPFQLIDKAPALPRHPANEFRSHAVHIVCGPHKHLRTRVCLRRETPLSELVREEGGVMEREERGERAEEESARQEKQFRMGTAGRGTCRVREEELFEWDARR